MMKKLAARIVSNENVAHGFYKMRIDSAYLGKASIPGQFIEVRPSAGINPLLRRPFGIHRITRKGIEILYEVVGEGTELISRKRRGESLDIIGPLGKGFDIGGVKKAVIIAGGMGVAPLLALAETLGGPRTHVIIGAKTRDRLLCEKDFNKIGSNVSAATEDGSGGHKGLATDLLKSLLGRAEFKPSCIYACGPSGMLRSVAHISASHRIPCQVSLEERMACGVGVCLGCPVKTRPAGEYKMVCKDGPVFSSDEIMW